jgi:hypothetical protein
MYAAWPHGVKALQHFEEFARYVVVGDKVQEFTIEPVQKTVVRAAQARGNARDCVKDRLEVGRRVGDHPQYLGGGAVLLQRVVALAFEPLELLLEFGSG